MNFSFPGEKCPLLIKYGLSLRVIFNISTFALNLFLTNSQKKFIRSQVKANIFLGQYLGSKKLKLIE